MSIPEIVVSRSDVQSRSLAVDSLVFSPGASCEHFVFVRAGTVRVELLTTTGHQLLLYRIHDGQSCVMSTSCVLGGDNYSAQAIAETPIELLLIPRATFKVLLEESDEFRTFVFRGFAERLAEMTGRMAELATSTVDERLAAALLAHDALLEISSPSRVIELTHDRLSVEIGTAREVISRRLAQFEKEELILRHRGKIEILDAQGLRAHLANA